MNPRGGYELLSNDVFVDRLHTSIESATERVFIQVMTFDGDAAGLGVAERLVAAANRGVDVRLTVDLFAFRYISDTRSTDPSVAAESADTDEMFRQFEAAGVEVSYVGPWGPLLIFGGVRNHKKIFVVDDTAYVGGINISDHNFAWLDFVVGTTHSNIVSELVDDFVTTRRGEKKARSGSIVTNGHIEETFAEMIESAKSSILIASPYVLDIDLERRLAGATAPSKTVISPEHTNFPVFGKTDPFMRSRLEKHGVDLVTFTDFFHAKFLLVDDTRLLIGSSNFGRHSFRCNQEVCLVIEDQTVIQALLAALPDTKPIAHVPSRVEYLMGFVAEYALFAVINVVEKVVVPRAPILASR